MKKYFIYIGVLALGLVSCEPEFENPVDARDAYTSGEANFSNYVALGNSLTAGFADNALYITGQENSYPSILAQQFAKVVEGDFDFIQPLMADNAGGLLLNGTQIYDTRLVLSFDAEGNPRPRNYRGAQPTTEVTERLTGPFNNMGVPGAKSFHLLTPGYGNPAGVAAGAANPYFARFASGDNTSVIADAVVQNPTFFSLWIGNNDVLSFATSGGIGVDQTGNLDPSQYGSNDITDPQVFGSVYSQLVKAMVEAGAEEGVLINIPDVTNIPFFTTVPYAPLSPANPNFGPMIPTLNQTFAQLNQAILAIRGVDESEGDTKFSIEFNPSAASPVVVRDESLTDISQQLTQALIGAGMNEGLATIYGMQYGQARQATPQDLLVLTSSGAIGQVNTERVQTLMAMGLTQEQAGQLSINGVTYPLEDRFVLVPSEVEMINSARLAYNQTIRQLADAYGLAFVDAAALLQRTATEGIAFDAGIVTSAFVTGGAFSLDGVHLTPRGYALMANQIIEEINETYNATVPKVNIGAYGTITPNNDVD